MDPQEKERIAQVGAGVGYALMWGPRGEGLPS